MFDTLEKNVDSQTQNCTPAPKRRRDGESEAEGGGENRRCLNHHLGQDQLSDHMKTTCFQLTAALEVDPVLLTALLCRCEIEAHKGHVTCLWATMVTMAFGRLSARLEMGRAGRCVSLSKSRKGSELGAGIFRIE